jgi:hypothetical protein
MSGKAVRTFMIAVLLVLVMSIASPAKFVPTPASTFAPNIELAEEHGTTAS